jgi:ketosteroid isomerase-like protein
VSQENVDAVRRIFNVWETERSPVPSGLLDPGIEWVNPPDAVERGTRQGIDAFGTAVDSLEAGFEDAMVEIDEILDAGDRVVVLGTLHGSGRGSGLGIDRRQGYIWTFRDGKAIRFEWFNTPDEALIAAGIHCSR